MATAKTNPFQKAADATAAEDVPNEAAEPKAPTAPANTPAEKAPAKKAAAKKAADKPASDAEKSGSEGADSGAGAAKAADADSTPAAEAAPEKKATARRSVKQVEDEAAEREAAMQKQIDELRAKVEGSTVAGAVDVIQDRTVTEGEFGGEIRVIGDGKTLVNDDWRLTKSGLVVHVGRASAQARNTFVIPLELVDSLGELLTQIAEIKEA